VNLAVGIAGLVGLIVAVLSLRLAVKHRNEAIREAAHERRVVFELTVLRDLLTWVNSYNSASDPTVRALLSALPEHDLPLLRICKKAEDEGRDLKTALYDELDRHGGLYPDLWVGHDRRAMLALKDEIRRSMEDRVR
jgi:hypothetical protein